MNNKINKDISIRKNSKKKLIRSREGFKLFLLTVPFLIATFVFNYMPLWGWSYAFFDYKAGFKLLNCNYVGMKHFLSTVNNPILREDIFRVLKNTFAMSFIGIATSMLPMFFAIFLGEITKQKFRKIVQTVTTIPNFISWVLVYSLAFSMFSINDGFVNRILTNLGLIEQGINFLASPNHVWLSMWAYGTWKGLGWGAIMYIAAITSIDEEMYQAADIDGAGRFQKIWSITIPSLLPTYFILLMLSIANFLNNGMEQYYVFQNAMNKSHIEVLDLYVYNKGMIGNNISFSTAVGMLKSLISIALLFTANSISKLVRKESML
jgi:putative aldouronate transport system permease protein